MFDADDSGSVDSHADVPKVNVRFSGGGCVAAAAEVDPSHPNGRTLAKVLLQAALAKWWRNRCVDDSHGTGGAEA